MSQAYRAFVPEHARREHLARPARRGLPSPAPEALWRFQIPETFPVSGGGGTRKQFGYPQLTETAKRKILGLNNARLYGIRNVDGRLTNAPDDCGDRDDRDHDDRYRDHDHDHDHHDRDDRLDGYHPVPTNFEALIPVSLKTMEYPQFTLDDRLSKMRKELLA